MIKGCPSCYIFAACNAKSYYMLILIKILCYNSLTVFYEYFIKMQNKATKDLLDLKLSINHKK